MDKLTRQEIDGLFAQCVRTDARLMAMQSVLSEVFRHNEEHKEAFSEDLENSYQIIYRKMVDNVKKRNPDTAKRVFSDIVDD